MSGEVRQEQPRRRRTPARAYPETDSLIDDYAEISALAPEQIRRYSGMR